MKIKKYFYLLLVVTLLGACSESSKVESKKPTLRFSVDVFAWFPDGKVIKSSPGDGIYFQACVHPSGTSVIYAGNKSGPVRVWKTSFSDNQPTALTPATSASQHPSYSWDGRQIVFVSDRDTKNPPLKVEELKATGLASRKVVYNVYIMDADGSNVRQITSGSFLDQRPTFSPDGKYIAFVSNRTSKWWRIFVVPTDGSTAPRVLQSKGWGYRPWFSPDGDTIYFHTAVDGRHQMVKIPFGGGEPTPLANDDQGTSRGAWVDPKGEVLLMHSNRDGDWGIWELPLAGGEPIRLIPPDYARALHPSRAENGVITFDFYKR
jgi:Tol biopolymer transport system component